MADGLGAGDNTRAAVITRGLTELSRLGVAMGGEAQTFAGLAGMGDLIATCISPQSRNRYVGEQLGKGRKIDEIIAEMNMVAEGVKTSKVVMELADEYDVEHADLPDMCTPSATREATRQWRTAGCSGVKAAGEMRPPSSRLTLSSVRGVARWLVAALRARWIDRDRSSRRVGRGGGGRAGPGHAAWAGLVARLVDRSR